MSLSRDPAHDVWTAVAPCYRCGIYTDVPIKNHWYHNLINQLINHSTWNL